MSAFTLPDPDGPVTVTGEVIGHASSDRAGKSRWFEVTLYALDESARDRHGAAYALHTVGRTAVTGEVDRHRVRFTDSPYEVVELLTDHRQEPPRLTYAATRALAQAAQRDSEVERAYLAAVA